jgi:hypothetical protein
VVVLVAPREALFGAESATTTVSSSSSSASCRMVSGIFREVWPGAKLNVPLGSTKSEPVVAVEPLPRPQVTSMEREDAAERNTSRESVPTPSDPEDAARRKETVGAASSSRIV